MSSVLNEFRFEEFDIINEPSAWLGHIPFGKFLIGLLRPRVFVELGTHYGHSYFAMCESVKFRNLLTQCFAVDTWEGDQHAGFYDEAVYRAVESRNNSQYAEFSTLLRMTFNEAVSHFGDGSIDLLHIDGLHTYDAVRHDYETWYPKLSNRAVVLFHDINVHDRDFGVWKFWDGIRQNYPHLAFNYSSGLGVLFVGKEQTQGAMRLLEEWNQPTGQQWLRDFFSNMGRSVEIQWTNQHLQRELAERTGSVETLRSKIDECDSRIDEKQLSIEQLTQEVYELKQQIKIVQAAAADEVQKARQQVSDIQWTVSERDKAIKILNQMLDDRSGQISDIRRTMEEKGRDMESREGELSGRIFALEDIVKAKDGRIAEISTQLSSCQQVLDSLLHSTTWKLTEPLRLWGRVARRLIRRTPDIQPTTVADSTTSELSQQHSPTSVFNQLETTSISRILATRWSQLSPIPIYTVPGDSGKRLNLVTDSINAGSLFGGVGTAIILSAMLAESQHISLRVITRTEPANEHNLWNILQQNGIRLAQDVEFLFVPPTDLAPQIDLRDTDVFITTSWWTTKSVLSSVPPQQIVYLLQEDERMFYPYGDDHLRCEAILKNKDIKYVVNTRLLYDHLVSTGLESIERNGTWFEPAFSSEIFYSSPEKNGAKRKLMFYARPNNLRNLFYFGIDIIQTAVTRGILDLNNWEIVFVGKDLEEIHLDEGYKPKVYQNLSWSEYANLIRSIDLGLCLMYTPHPSYPPLDLAASGAVVVTNSFGNKKNLDEYCANILCGGMDVEDMVSQLQVGIKLVEDTKTRMDQYLNARVGRDWNQALQDVVKRLGGVF